MLKEYFNVKDDSQFDFVKSYNISPGSFLPVVYKDVVIKASNMKWGLIPFFTKDNKMSFPNTRIETVDIKISFKDSFRKRRCLIPVSGYYEWKNEEGKKIPYYFHSKDNGVIALAGIYNKTENGSCNFTIFTKESTEKLKEIHERMPVIIPKESWETWLNENSSIELIKNQVLKNAFEDLKFHKVSSEVNNPRNNIKDLVNEI